MSGADVRVSGGTPVLDPPIVDDVADLEPVGATSLRGLVAEMRSRLRSKGMGGVLVRGAVWSLGISGVGAVIALGTQIVLARALGKEGYGIYAYVLAWMNVAAVIAKLELDNAAVRFVGAYTGTRSWGALRGYLQTSTGVVLALSFGIGVTAALVIALFSTQLGIEQVWAFWFAAALLPASALLQLGGSVLQGFKKVPQSQAPTLILRPALFGGIVALLAFGMHKPVDAAQAVMLQLFATGVALLVIALLIFRHIPREAIRAPIELHRREWVRTSAGMLVIALSQLVLSAQSDVLIVGTYRGTAQAGIYGIANQLATLVSFGVTAVVFIASPMIAHLHAAQRKDQLQRLVRVVSEISLAVTLPVLLGLVIFGHWILSWFGAAFVSGYPVLLILGSGQLVSATVGILGGYLLTMTGNQARAAVIIGGSAALNLGLTFILTPRFGPVGTASATATATLVRSFLLIGSIWKLLGIEVVPVPHRRKW